MAIELLWTFAFVSYSIIMCIIGFVMGAISHKAYVDSKYYKSKKVR